MQEQHAHDDSAPKKPPLQRYQEEHQDKPLFFLGRKQDIRDEAIDDLAGMAREAWEVIRQANTKQTRFFLLNSKPGYLTLNSDAVLQAFTPASLKSTLSELAYFYFVNASMDDDGNVKREYKTRTAPNFLIAQMLNSPLYTPPLPELERIVTAPYFTERFTLHQSPGYHSQSKAYYHLTDDRLNNLKVPNAPKEEEVKAARNLILHDLLVDFPFSSDAERAHAVCVLLQPFIRSWFDVTPFFLIESARAGTGKGLLGDVLIYPFLGEMPTRSPEQKNPEAWQKLITTILLTIPSIVFFDNIKRPVNDGSLESILTNPTWGDRMLGSNNAVKLVNRATWLFAGNNVQIGEEIARRTVRIRMVANMANPNQRQKFTHPYLREWVQQRRVEIVQAALTLVQHWIQKGKPIFDDAPIIGSYETWCQTMHGILSVCDIQGFLGNLSEMNELPKADWDDITDLIQQIWLLKHRDPWKVQDAFEIVAADETIAVDLGQSANARSQRVKLGKLLSKNRDRVFLVEEQEETFVRKSEVKLMNGGSEHRAIIWKLALLRETWTATVRTLHERDQILEQWVQECNLRSIQKEVVPEEPILTYSPPVGNSA